MVNLLKESGSLNDEDCIAAFEAVDRGHFWPLKNGVNDGVCYLDGPLRHGRLHMSAPSIYAQALEALQPRPGLSFLNIGSGTGYFSAVVSELIGSYAVSHGIDICEEHVRRSTARCQKLGKNGIEFFPGNVFQLDVRKSMRYDRIYIGACCKKECKYLCRLLKVGGILVGPFKTRRGNSQKLRKVIRLEEDYFESEILETVYFASLVEPPRQIDVSQDSRAARPIVRNTTGFQIGDAETLGLPGIQFTFSLNQEIWSPEKTPTYPETFQRVINSVARLGPQAGALPVEMWTEFILPLVPKFWFEPEHPAFLERARKAEEIQRRGNLQNMEQSTDEEGSPRDDVSDSSGSQSTGECQRQKGDLSVTTDEFHGSKLGSKSIDGCSEGYDENYKPTYRV
jgi:protein-L-isoaspartate(D-aspartate) O-methyltransferase